MIQLLTKVNIIDNSGGLIGRCIKILSPHGRDYAKVGDIILVSIKETIKSSNTRDSQLKGNKLTKGSMFKALVVRTKSSCGVLHKKLAKYDDNAVVLLKSNVNANKSKTININSITD
jgi:large subunit ribosomal protein L14